MPQIAIERGPEKGRAVQLSADKEVIVGRDPEATLTITDTMSSRRHVRFFIDEGGNCVVEDLGSRNGTLLNGDALEGQHPITVGDKLEIGETLISVLDKSEGVKKDKLVDKEIGGYRILERLGRGGMGTVYKANQLNLDRVVALKILSREWNDPGFVEKFRAEARAAGQLNHPNLIQVYDVGDVKVKNGSLNYFSMEYAGGGSVQDLLNEHGKLTLDQALRIMIDAARGLEYAEKKQLVHRDIKPDNLMISEGEMVKIGDLGLAQTTDAQDSEPGKESKIFGTPHFVSPEQIKGEKVDHRADLYSLGATFFRILTGRTPFLGDNVKEIIVKQVREQPTDPREVDSDIPKHIAEIILKLMKKDPAERYQHASELLVDLHAAVGVSDHLATGSVTRLRTSEIHSTRIPRKKGFPVGAALGIIAAAIVGLVLVNMLLGNGETDDPDGPGKGKSEKTIDKPANKSEERILKAQLAEMSLERKFRGMSPTPEMADAYEEAGKKFKDTETGKKLLAKAKQLRLDYAKNRDDQAKRLYDAAESARSAAGNVVSKLDKVREQYQAVIDKYGDTDWAAKAKTALEQLDKQVGSYKDQIQAYLKERKQAEQRMIQLAREQRYAQVIQILEALKKKYTHAEIASRLASDIRGYTQEGDRAFRKAKDAATGHRMAKRFDEAITALDVAYRIGLPGMATEADKLKKQIRTEKTNHAAQEAAAQLADDSERYEQLLARLRGKSLLGSYRLDNALEVASSAEAFQTTEYQTLHEGLLEELKAIARLFSARRDRFGEPLKFTLPADLAAKNSNLNPVGKLVGVTRGLKGWNFRFSTKVKGVNAQTGIPFNAGLLPSGQVIRLLGGQNNRKPRPSERLDAICAASLLGVFGWAKSQLQTCEMVIPQGDNSVRARLKVCQKRLAAIRKHVAHEWRRAVAARTARRTGEALRIARRLQRHYGELLK